jgi:hypothetical protein
MLGLSSAVNSSSNEGGAVFKDLYSTAFETNDYILTTADDTLADATYSFWAKSTDTTINTQNIVFGHGAAAKGAFYFNYASSKPLLYMHSASFRYWDDVSAQDDGEWHHWAVVIDADDITGCLLYCDGSVCSVQMTEDGGSFLAYATDLCIGGNGSGSGAVFDGSINDFAWFNTKLSASSIAAIRNNGVPFNLTLPSGNYTETANLSGYWRMGDSAIDDNNVAGNGLIGDFKNATRGAELITDPGFDTDVASGVGTHWTVETGWVIADGVATKTAGVANHVYTSGSIASAGNAYKVKFTLTRTAGALRLYCGDTNVSGDISASGTYTYYGVQAGGAGDIKFYGNSTFAGTLDNISARQVNGKPGIMTNMPVDAIERDTP